MNYKLKLIKPYTYRWQP